MGLLSVDWQEKSVIMMNAIIFNGVKLFTVWRLKFEAIQINVKNIISHM